MPGSSNAPGEGRAVLLENLPWPEISALRQLHGGMLLLPLGATEQHGPHLPVAMDSLLAERACHEASARTGVPILPTLSYTVSLGHTPKWPGTFSLRHDTFIATIVDIANWAAATGWKRLLMVNAHFGNDAPARVALDQIRLRHTGELQVGLRNVFHLTREITDLYISDAADLHANDAETSLMLHLFPGLVRMEKLHEADDPDRTYGTVFSYPVSQTSLNGVTGYPSRATAEKGAALFARIVDALAETISRGIGEVPPLSAEHWQEVPRP